MSVWGSAPDPAGGAYSAPPDPLAGFGWDREGRGQKIFGRTPLFKNLATALASRMLTIFNISSRCLTNQFYFSAFRLEATAP